MATTDNSSVITVVVTNTASQVGASDQATLANFQAIIAFTTVPFAKLSLTLRLVVTSESLRTRLKPSFHRTG